MIIEHLRLLGSSHHTAHQDFRDHLGVAIQACDFPMGLLVTCNRVECYYWDDSGQTSTRGRDRIASAMGIPESAAHGFLYEKSGMAAALHLMRVAGGLDSIVLGEDQILGQVGEAGRSIPLGTPGTHELAELFREAVRVGRRVRAGHRLSPDASVAEAGIHWLANSHIVDFQGATVTVIGAGKMARSAAMTLAESGVARLLLVNRSVDHAESLVSQIGRIASAEARGLESLERSLSESDLVVGATRSPNPVVHPLHLQLVTAGVTLRRLVFLDLAAPRDIDPAVRTFPGVSLYDLDDLGQALGKGSPRDPLALESAELMAMEGAIGYARWLRIRAAAPAIVALRRQGERLLCHERRRMASRMKEMPPTQREAVERSMRRLTNQLLHGPTIALRQAAAEGHEFAPSDLLSLPLVEHAVEEHGMD